MSLIDGSALQMLERYLDLTTYRQKLIASNMANVDTPRYRTRDIDFRSELHRATQLNQTKLTPLARQVSGLLERPDGNNVSLEREGLAMAETQLKYRLGVDLMRAQFRHIRSAIRGGR